MRTEIRKVLSRIFPGLKFFRRKFLRPVFPVNLRILPSTSRLTNLSPHVRHSLEIIPFSILFSNLMSSWLVRNVWSVTFVPKTFFKICLAIRHLIVDVAQVAITLPLPPSGKPHCTRAREVDSFTLRTVLSSPLFVSEDDSTANLDKL